jgi:hypothetical protein
VPLSAGEYLLGLAELGAIAIALGLGAVRVRRRLLPAWSGAPARLVEVVLGLAALLWVCELVGAVGLYRESAVVVGCVLAGTVAALLTSGPRFRPAGDAPPAPRASRILAWVAVAVAVVVVAHWSVPTRLSLNNGMYGYDTTWYHMPFAARFVQDASLTGLHFSSTSFLSWFYPANSELFHSVGILVTERDYLSPLINLTWLGLALLAAWCIGRPWGLGPASTIGACVVLGAGVFGDQPGEARNDIPATFFLLASAAVLVNAVAAREELSAIARGAGRWTPSRLDLGPVPLAIAALAAGMAIGTKLSLLAPIGALTIGIVVVAHRRLPATGIWFAGLLAGGGFWFVRNLVATGNPLPWLSALGPLPLPGPEEVLPNDREPFSVVHYATDTEVWSEWFFPGLVDRLGELWPLVLALGALGAGLALFRERSPAIRILGFAALAAALAYPFTPLTASGYEDKPIGFASNLRYLAPVLALALALLPITLRDLRETWRWAALGALLVAFAAAFVPDGQRSGFAVGLLVSTAVAILLIGVVAAYRGGWLSRALMWAGATGAVLIAVAVGYVVQRNYLEERYADVYGIAEPGLDAAFIWARDIEDSRIATITIRQYPYYGGDLSNFVQYVGRRGDDDSFVAIRDCAEWREALNAGDYDYVVTGGNFPGPGQDHPPQSRWTGDDPAATEILAERTTSVFRLDGELAPAACDEP